jgi:hypothetical protein
MPKFKIKMTPLKLAESPLYMQRDPGDEQGLPATSDASQATIWTIDIANHLITADGNQIVTFYNDMGDGTYYFNGYSIDTYEKYEKAYFTPVSCSINPTDFSLVCKNNNANLGYLQYRNGLNKWMYYNLAGPPPSNPSYPAYSATIVPV